MRFVIGIILFGHGYIGPMLALLFSLGISLGLPSFLHEAQSRL